MQGLKKFNLLQFLFLLNILFETSSSSQENPLIYICGGIKIQSPFLTQSLSFLSNMILCKSDKLYYRTSIGLFQISSIDYKNKLLTISHNSCSKTSNFISPHHLSAGFSNPTRPNNNNNNNNSIVLWNCQKNRDSQILFSPCDNSTSIRLNGCFGSCSVIDDARKLGKGFDPREMKCTHYSRVYRSLSGNVELGTRISFDVPDHVPNPCDECEKHDGNCGVGLRCVCHPMKCKDKVTNSVGEGLKPCGNMFFDLVLFIVVMGILQC